LSPKKPLAEVFKTVGLPPYTYVKPAYYGEVRADILQPGKHLLIEGPSGVGKTCVVFKVFEDLGWSKGREYEYISARDLGAQQRVEDFLTLASRGGLPAPLLSVIDDFHLFPVQQRASLGATLKRISDLAFEHATPPKVILIGIPTSGTSLLSEAYDLGPRLGSYRFSRASDSEIDRLVNEGEAALNILFEDRDILLAESAGNFWLAQYICNKVCATQEVFESQDEVRILTFDLLGIRQRLMTELSQRYIPVAKTFAKGKKWRPGGNKPYLEVLLALSKQPDSVVTYDRILNAVPERRRPGLKAIRSRIPEVIFDSVKGVDLRKQIAFDPASGFSIEDPLFRYYLSNVDAQDLYRELGVEAERVERARLYAYDIGFSFAGDARPLVEVVNDALKTEDVVTFYDFDQQSVLLALDLEQALQKIYSESCRFYLVFLDENYNQKIWTKYEKDIMTRPGRKDHIIPVVVDDQGAGGVAGISKTIGRIDLREQWAELRTTGGVTPDVMNAIRNRCVLPLLEKLDEPSGPANLLPGNSAVG
jgi:hypothetical protein